MAVLMLAVRLTFSLTLMGLLVSAGKKCSFNGKKFDLDDVVYQMNDNCAELKCVMEGKKNILKLKKMEGCSIMEWSNTCNFNGKSFEVDDVAYQMTDNCAELKCVMEGNRTVLMMKQMEGCSFPEPINECTFNGEIIAVDDIAYQVPEDCEELKCVMEGNEPLLIMKPMEGCIIVASDLAPTLTSIHKCNYKQFDKNHTMLMKRNKNCKFHKSGITEEQKQIILKTHNDLRTKIARGKEQLGDPGPQPKAANMPELVWNDQLAEVAQAWAEQCPRYHDLPKNRRICNSTYKNTGQNIYNNLGHTDQNLWKKAVESWYGEVKNMPRKDVGVYQKPASGGVIAHYTQIVWAKTTEVGCGAIYYTAERKGVTYSNSKKYICNYGPAGNMNRAPIYRKGKTSSKCKSGKSKNFPHLCA